MSDELDRIASRNTCGAAAARSAPGRLAPDHPAHFHPQVAAVRRRHRRPDLRVVAAAEHDRRRQRRRGAVQIRLDFGHPSLSEVAEHALRRQDGARRAGRPGNGSACRLPDLRRRPRPTRQDRGTRARRRAAEGSHHPEILHPRRARLVSRHGQEVGGAVRPAQLDLRPQGRALHRSRHGQPRPRLLDGEEHDAGGAHGSHVGARRHRRRAVGRRRPGTARLDGEDARRLGQGQADHHLQPQSALRILPALELLGARLARGERGAEALHQGHQHPRPRAPGALQRDRHHALDRHAGDLMAVALCAGGRAEADEADDPCRSRRSVRRRRLGQDRRRRQ